MYDVQTGQSTQIAKHDAPIRVIKYVDTPSGGIVVTGSWDKTIKVRDYHLTETCALIWQFSTGISEVKTLYHPSPSLNVAIAWMYPTH